MMTVTAPAKLNLTLEILHKRPDGYHEIKSVIQTISLCDKLRFQAGLRMEYRCTSPVWRAEKSLVSRAAEILQRQTGTVRGAGIEIDKHIPLVSGLGGDSSDAAGVLRGLNLLWDLRLSLRELSQIAAELGSDVPLFLLGGTLMAEGRGEKLKPLPPAPHAELVLLVPPLTPVENKTARLYGFLNELHFNTGRITDDFVAALKAGQSAPPELYNAFETPAYRFFRGLKDFARQFQVAGAPEIHLAGSGPTLFCLFSDPSEADKVWQNLKEKGLEVYRADF